MSYKLGSLFDGSGGFPLAGSLCGIEPRWASEVEPYPIAVTRERFPQMKHLGDISKINGAEIEPVDIITFGSPCQDLSVAGKRAGLKHEANGDEETTRSGLFMEAVRIIKEMREATNGEYPRFALWENVPGAFSSNKGEDFRVVCEELIKITEPAAFMPPVPKAGWAYADSYVGDGWSLAYRVFDAQHWGVPQRRRRIHLVVDFGGQCAGKILFEREGVRWYFAESRTSWQATAGDAQSRAGADDRERAGANGARGGHELAGLSPYMLKIRAGVSGKVQTLTSRMGTGGGNVPMIMEPDTVVAYYDVQRTGQYSENGVASTQAARQYKDSTDLIVEAMPAVAYRQGGFADYVEGEVGTLRATGGDYGGSTETLLVTPPRYIVRRLTPTECARLQGFPDAWGHIPERDSLTDEECTFWQEVRDTYATLNGKPQKDYTPAQLLTWYNKLHTDSAEYKMWGNGIALPPALYVLQGMADVLSGNIDSDCALVAENTAEPTDLSDAPEDIKAEIIENAEKLEERETAKEATEEETMEQKNIEEQATAKETTPTDFCAVAQLRRLAEERKALANLRPEDPRFSNDVRAIEYAVNILEAVGL